MECLPRNVVNGDVTPLSPGEKSNGHPLPAPALPAGQGRSGARRGCVHAGNVAALIPVRAHCIPCSNPVNRITGIDQRAWRRARHGGVLITAMTVRRDGEATIRAILTAPLVCVASAAR